MNKLVHVAVGVIIRDQQIFLTKRLANAHQGGKWEFPGGKLEADESVGEALHRELQEEIAIDVLSCNPLLQIKHDYGDKQVLLDVFIITNFLGEPTAQEGQEQIWFPFSQLSSLDFPQANKAIVKKLEEYFE
ncbi:MAG: 8-oxo-dGTP diphosphatase MutT [Alteromonadaceae bacterium]|nr:8-oxo-dGTP diphosphatase MutT [Alteromonadaceae bacterium]